MRFFKFSAALGVLTLPLGLAIPARAIDPSKVVLPPDCQVASLGDMPLSLGLRMQGLRVRPPSNNISYFAAMYKTPMFDNVAIDYEAGQARLIRLEAEFSNEQSQQRISKFLDYVTAAYGAPDFLTVNRLRPNAKPELVWYAPDRRIRASYSVTPGPMYWTPQYKTGGHYTLVINMTGWPKIDPRFPLAPVTREEAVTMLTQTQAELNRRLQPAKQYLADWSFLDRP